jgi:PadR family transcriptional regulator AphA
MASSVRNRSTTYAMLGMLTIKPMSGYEMKQLMSQSIAHFWSESYGQLYPGLKQLEKEGLASSKTEKSRTGRPDRQVYAITARGREALQEWLRQPPKTQPPRSELLLKLFFTNIAKGHESLEHVQRLQASAAAEIETYAAIEAQLRKHHAQNPNLPYWLMTLSFGRHRSAAMRDWAEEALRELQGLRGKR